MTAELGRVEREMRQASPACAISRHLHTVDDLMQHPGLLAPPPVED